MKSAWLDPEHVRHWNDVVVSRTPSRAEHLDILRAFFQTLPSGRCSVLDLGCGTGLVAEALAESRPGMHWLGVDGSAAMLDIARTKQFASASVQWVHADVAGSEPLPWPAHSFDCVLAVQLLHILEHDEKRAVFEKARAALAPGGTLFVMDRFLLSHPELHEVFNAARARQQRLSGDEPIAAPSYEEYVNVPHESGDRVESVSAHLQLLAECDFAADVVHAHADRALIAARVR